MALVHTPEWGTNSENRDRLRSQRSARVKLVLIAEIVDPRELSQRGSFSPLRVAPVRKLAPLPTSDNPGLCKVWVAPWGGWQENASTGNLEQRAPGGGRGPDERLV